MMVKIAIGRLKKVKTKTNSNSFNETSEDFPAANVLRFQNFDITRKAIREISECVRSFTPYIKL